jgi:hypothetical protein
LKWRLTTETKGTTPPSVSNIRHHPAWQAGHRIQFQRQLKGLLKVKFEFRNTRSGTRVVTKGRADFSAIRSHFESNNLPYFTFYPKSQKSVKAVIQHLPFTTPA